MAWMSDDGTAALWDWRRRVSEIYAEVRDTPDSRRAWSKWRSARDALFQSHPQSPIEPSNRAAFDGLRFVPYDPELRFTVRLKPVSGDVVTVPVGADGDVRLRPFAETVGLAPAFGKELTMFWIDGYGGGAFLPFTDATSRDGSYGGGRYLLDTIKGADLGTDAEGKSILDFNFAYNPSCSYSAQYTCPLSPPINQLWRPVRGGEQI